MKKTQIGALFIVSILAIAGLGVTYAGFNDTITVYGTVNTATVHMDIAKFSGTWVYKVWGWTNPQNPPGAPTNWPGLQITWDPAKEILVVRGFNEFQPTAQMMDDWLFGTGAQWQQISYAQADPGTTHGSIPYDVDMLWNNIFPCTDFVADVVIHYTGTIPVHIALPTPTWVTGQQYFADSTTFKAFRYTDEGSRGLIKGDEITTWPIQVHPGEYVGIEVWIHIPQVNDLQGKQGEFTFNIVAVQWNEQECQPPSPECTRTYTTDADFDEGTLVNLEHTTTHDQLQIVPGGVTTYPIMWLANAGEDSISKWDTVNNKELARYHTWFGPLANHDAWTGPSPSRTCVDAFGNCYVANRHFDGLQADVIKIYVDNWIDRNGNGVMDTSYDASNDGYIQPSEMTPAMVDANSNNHIDPNEIIDERVAWVVSVGDPGGLGRSLSIDPQGNLWLGLYNSMVYYKLSSVDGSILGGPYDVSPHQPYGSLVDQNGILWGPDEGYSLLKFDTNTATMLNIYYHYSYGANYGIALGYDSTGATHVYLGSQYGYGYIEFNSATNTFSAPLPYGSYPSLGIATDSMGNIIVGNSATGGVAKFAPDGTLLWSATPQVNSEARGTLVDSNNNVWTQHLYMDEMSKFSGVDGSPLGVFNTGHFPYTYSDATGLGHLTQNPVGTWKVIFNCPCLSENTVWNRISWTSTEPTGTSITVQVRSSNNQILWSPYETAVNGVDLSATPPGVYLEVTVTFQKAAGSSSPVLYDLTIDGTCSD